MSFSFPFWFVLIPYGLALLIVAVMAALALHHLNGYGASRWISLTTTFAYLLGTILILLTTASMLRETDWTAPVSFAPSFGDLTPTVSGTDADPLAP